MPTFSVIVPVYNCETTVERALSSVLDQSFRDIEVIAVDDASTDSSLRVIESIASKDNRVKVIPLKENGRCFAARQSGVEASSGSYVLFLDADDEYLDGALTVLASNIESDPADILHFGVSVSAPSEEASLRTEAFLRPYDKTIHGGAAILEKCYCENEFNWNLVNKAFNGDLCRSVFAGFEKSSVQRGEDLLAFTSLAYHADTYRGIKDAVLYRYNYGAGQDGDKTITLEELDSLCESSKVAEALDGLFAQWNVSPQLAQGLAKIQARLIDNCTAKFKRFLPDPLKADGLDILFARWGAEKTIVSLMRCGYLNNPAKLCKKLAATRLMAEQRKPVSSIGAYYRSSEGGGAEKVLRDLTALWLEQGYRVTWFLEESPQDSSCIPEGVDVVLLPDCSKLAAGAYQERMLVLRQAIATYDIDAFVYHQWLSNTLLWDLLAIKTLQVNFIVHCHGLFTNKMRFGLYGFAHMPDVYALADAIVVINPTDKLFWSNFSNNVYQTNNVLSADSFKSNSCGDFDNQTVLWLGRLSPEKHPEKALEIFAEVHRRCPSASFVLAGSASNSDYEDSLHSKVEELGLEETVSMPGWCDGEKKRNLFEHASIFLMTSEEREGFPLTLIESKAAGLPCVMFDLPYLTMLQPAEGICTAPQGDTFSAAEFIIKLLTDKTYYSEISEEASRSFKRFDEYDQASFWRDLFAEVPTLDHAPRNAENAIMWDMLFDSYSVGLDTWKRKVDAKERQRKKLDAQLKKKNKEIAALKRSSSWKAGRAVTCLPRAIKRMVKKASRRS